jgi:hypothetical protein
VPERIEDRADEASPRDPPEVGVYRKNFPLCVDTFSGFFLSVEEEMAGKASRTLAGQACDGPEVDSMTS